MPPLCLSTLRFLLAGALAPSWALSRRRPSMQRSALIGGVLLIAIGQGALIYANQFMPTGLRAMLYTTLPMWSAALEWLLGERPAAWVIAGQFRRVLGVLLALA
jgi:drug/metabolite transporter (DMT)-like permease